MTKHSNKETKKTICPSCNGESIKKNGTRKTENRGNIQRYKCKECSFRFTIDDGFYRMRNTPQKITQSVDLFFRGISTRKVQEHLAIFHPHNASNVSIYKWVVKYSKMISKFTNSLKLKVGSEVQIDEMELHRRKSHKAKKGVDKNWFIDSIDPDTKFLISGEYSKTRGKRDIKAVVSKIKDKTGSQIETATTDGLLTYRKIIKSVWGYNNKLRKHNVDHNRVNASKGEGFNHPIERLHNNVRQRTKTMRGFHGSIHSANAILKGFGIYYNFITKHQTIKCSPYELACPDLKLEGNNRWLELIERSKEI
ncbi:MAG: DDE-type integrase/transposase/recombinase [Nanoarchaeota archaeon]|nr:DDE-type integrase/transposase/recombinase [Nanoarchaeota archaeon]